MSLRLMSGSQPSYSSYPLVDIVNLYHFAYRNRCMWKIRGTISFIREVQVYRRCLFCYQPLNSSRHQCNNCHRTISPTEDNIWWRCVGVIDDGTSEANVCFEGPNAILFLQSCYQVHTICVADLPLMKDSKISFSDIQKLIEMFVQKHSIHLDSQHLASMSFTTGNESKSSSSHFFSRSICLCQRYHQLLSSSKHLPRPQKDSSQSYPLELLYLLDNLLSHCSFSSSYEMTIKIIHSKQRSEMNRSDGSAEDLFHRYPKKKKKISVQKFNDPYWLIENIEYISEVYESLRFDCHDVKVIQNTEIAEIAWTILHDLE
jgi:hypothetical protein